MNCKTANEISIPLFLESLGFKKLKKHRSGKEFFFENPIRSEKEASFSVHIEKNAWYDFGLGEGGKMVDLIKAKERTDVKGALSWLRNNLNNIDISNTDNLVKDREFIEPPARFQFRKSTRIFSFALKDYLKERNIDFEIAEPHVREIRFWDGEKKKEYFSLGMRNNSGGYSLRNKLGKVILAPNDIRYIPTNSKTDTILVFEGMFDFLSYLMIKKTTVLSEDVIILNTLTFAKRALKKIESLEHIERIISFLDNPRKDNVKSVETMTKALDILKSSDLDMYLANSLYEAYSDIAEYWESTGERKEPQLQSYPENAAFLFS